MKKIIKIVALSLFLCGLVALALCYIIIPEETKSAADVVVGYMNTPLGIIGGSTITIGVVVGIVIKVVYDRYKDSVIADLKKTKSSVESYVKDKEDNAKEYYDLALKEREETKAILDGYSSRIDNLVNELVKVCETIPNVKVKALAEEIKSGNEEIKEEVAKALEETDNSFSKESVNKVKELENKVNELVSIIERLESQYGKEESNN